MHNGGEDGWAERKMVKKKQFEYQDLEQMSHYREQTWLPRGKEDRGEMGWEFGGSIYRMDKQQGPTHNTGDCIQ